MSLWLSKEEVVELTGYKHSTQQKLALAQMGIKFRSRAADGFPMVDRWQFEGEVIRPRRKRRGPNFPWLREPGHKK